MSPEGSISGSCGKFHVLILRKVPYPGPSATTYSGRNFGPPAPPTLSPPFRVKILANADADGGLSLRFQHPAPVEVGELGNIGWREEENARQLALAAGLHPAPPHAAPKVSHPGAM